MHTTQKRRISDPGGTVTDLGRSVYRPSARLAALVRATYPTCVFPGCGQPSYRCDLDHAVRWVDGGETSSANMIVLCRRHHRAKDEGGWQVERNPDGSCDWTSPAGRTYQVRAAHYLADADSDAWMVPEDWTVDLASPPRPRTANAPEPPPADPAESPVDLSAEPPPPF